MPSAHGIPAPDPFRALGTGPGLVAFGRMKGSSWRREVSIDVEIRHILGAHRHPVTTDRARNSDETTMNHAYTDPVAKLLTYGEVGTLSLARAVVRLRRARVHRGAHCGPHPNGERP
jgi:hypothetical protein